MDLMLKGKNAIVSGSSQGIGFYIARDLAIEGCNVLINGRRQEAVEKAIEQIEAQSKSKIIGFVGDITKPELSSALVQKALNEFGNVDVLVNSVGGSNPKNLTDTDDKDWQEAFEFNLFHAVRISRLVVKDMQRNNGGSILNVASIAGRESGSAMTYNASKAALISFTKALAQQVAKDNIRVNSIAPGSIFFPGGVWERRMADSPDNLQSFVDSAMPLGRFGKPEEVSAVAVFMLSPRASLVHGACWNVDGCQSKSNI
jgi:3-oxoacyl-[acyl-carrier protein] reductase